MSGVPILKLLMRMRRGGSLSGCRRGSVDTSSSHRTNPSSIRYHHMSCGFSIFPSLPLPSTARSLAPTHAICLFLFLVLLHDTTLYTTLYTAVASVALRRALRYISFVHPDYLGGAPRIWLYSRGGGLIFMYLLALQQGLHVF